MAYAQQILIEYMNEWELEVNFYLFQNYKFEDGIKFLR